MERFQQKQMKLDQLTEPRLGEAANCSRERDEMYGTSELRVPEVVKLQMDQDTTPPASRTFGERMESLDIVPGISQMLQGTSQPGSSHMRLGSGKPQSDTGIPSVAPAMELESLPMLQAKPVEPVSFYPCI